MHSVGWRTEWKRSERRLVQRSAGGRAEQRAVCFLHWAPEPGYQNGRSPCRHRVLEGVSSHSALLEWGRRPESAPSLFLSLPSDALVSVPGLLQGCCLLSLPPPRLRGNQRCLLWHLMPGGTQGKPRFRVQRGSPLAVPTCGPG